MLVSCLYPQHVYNKYLGKDIAVPCGHCAACQSHKALEWSNRLEFESQCHKYTLFVTLTYGTDKVPFTYADSLTDIDTISPTLQDSLLKSSEYLKVTGGKIYHHSVKHIQLFFKRLRINLVRKLHLDEKERQIRYFCAHEFGPSGFRPHYHLLVWFDSDKIAKSIREYIYQAWKPYTTLQDYEAFAKINHMSFVRTSCAQYVAGYLNTDSMLPSILREPPFRQRHQQSACPPIGRLYVKERQIREFIFGDATCLNLRKPSTSRDITLSLWRSLESRYFPRCPQFATLTASQRVAMYKFSTSFGLVKDYRTFEERFLREWSQALYDTEEYDPLGYPMPKSYTFQMWELYRQVFSDFQDCRNGECVPNKRSVKAWYYVSRRISKLCLSLGVGIPFYVSRICAYYERKNYDALVAQLKYEQDFTLTKTFRIEGLTKLPFLIDPLFYENKRNLPSSTYDLYLSQFGVTDKPKSVPQTSMVWQHYKSLYQKIRRDNTKTRVHKEFVAYHPEYANIYLQNRLYAAFR